MIQNVSPLLCMDSMEMFLSKTYHPGGRRASSISVGKERSVREPIKARTLFRLFRLLRVYNFLYCFFCQEIFPGQFRDGYPFSVVGPDLAVAQGQHLSGVRIASPGFTTVRLPGNVDFDSLHILLDLFHHLSRQYIVYIDIAHFVSPNHIFVQDQQRLLF